MADMQRPRRIGGDEFNLDFFACADPAAAVSSPATQNMRYDLLFGGRLEKEIDKSGARHFRFFHVRRSGQRVKQGAGEIARIAA